MRDTRAAMPAGLKKWLAVIGLTAVAVILTAGTSWASHEPCADLIDQDADGQVDVADPDCASPSDESEGPLTTPDAELEAESEVFDRFYDDIVAGGSSESASCFGVDPDYECDYTYRQRVYRYLGSVRVVRFFDPGIPGDRIRVTFGGFRGSCGDLQPEGAGVYGITTRNLLCGRARRIAQVRFYGRGSRCYTLACARRDPCILGPGICRVRGFRCYDHKTGIETRRYRCVRGNKQVRFTGGA